MGKTTFRYRAAKSNGCRICEEESVYVARQDGVLLRKQVKPTLIDLFCGAGGLTLGFTKLFGHRFETVWANDSNGFCVETYNANFGNHANVGDIVQILREESGIIPKAEVVIGGPPCQGFSLLNKKRHLDPGKQLWRPFLDVVKLSGASVFLMENVPELLRSAEYARIRSVCGGMGFDIASMKLCAADYGVPQVRWRAFILGCSFADPSEVFPPRKTHYNPSNGFHPEMSTRNKEYIADPQPWRTVRDGISNLSEPVGTQMRDVTTPYDLHFGRSPTIKSLMRYQAIPQEGMNRFDLLRKAPELTPQCWIRKKTGGTDLFGRLWWDRPAFTIRTEFFKPEKGRYLHPSKHRPITHREAARLQSFPDDFVFKGTKIEIAKQIGNAVPPQLSARLADSVYALLLSRKPLQTRYD